MPFIDMTREGNSVFFQETLAVTSPELTQSYANAAPFPHIVIDDFMPIDILREVAATFPEKNIEVNFSRSVERGKVSFNPDKLQSSLHRSLFYSFNSRPFIELIEQLTGIDGLLPDPYFLGGGYHQTSNRGHLSVHADFNLHQKLRLKRRVNVLIYLNENWKSEYGGALELWERDMSQKVQSIEPIMNRCVIFNTDDTSYHGHPEPLNTPVSVSRRSIALYYYTASEAVFSEFSNRTTLFKPRKGTADKLSFSVRLLYILNDLLPPFLMRFLLTIVRKNGS